ncbi:MAG: hypothetical protein ACI8UR_001923 [Natronomonas sp.]|jgi:hypothetical protein|uniref:hypothetical protein n=1 Tax=Natronomonas sp. TaxID=2184060 RepID=UPI003989C916
MVPGFVRLGFGAVLFQLVVIAAVYAYVGHQNPIPEPVEHRRPFYALSVGGGLLAIGQLSGLVALWSLRVVVLLSLGQAIRITNVGVGVAVVGYVVVAYALYARSNVGGTWA